MDIKQFLPKNQSLISIIIIIILISPLFWLDVEKEPQVVEKEPVAKTKESKPIEQPPEDIKPTHKLDQILDNPITFHNHTVVIKGLARIITINHRTRFYGFRFYANGKKIFVGTYNPNILPENDDQIILTGIFTTSQLSPAVWGNYPYVIEALDVKKID